MNDEHQRTRESLGAYVLGGLSHEERLSVERHVAECESCRDELTRLAPLPQLLERLDEGEVTSDALRAPAAIGRRTTAALAEGARRDRRQLWAWRGAAVAAVAALAVVLWAPWEGTGGGPAPLTAPARPVDAPVEGSASLIEWEWGTTVRIEVTDLPRRDAYLLWAVDEGGERQQAGTWGPTADGRARVVGASAIPRDRLARVEITDAGGAVLAAFEP